MKNIEMSSAMVNYIQQDSILIVDDKPNNIKVLFDILDRSGFRVSVAKSGESALSKVQDALPSLILLDVMMPGIDGFDTCRSLKANPKTQEIPIIFLSALDEVVDKVKAFAAGGVDYITKPFQVEEVLARVQNQLALRAAKAEICKLNAELEQRVRQRTAQLSAANQELEREISERKKAEKALAQEKAHLLDAQQVAHVGSWEFDMITQEIRWSDETFRIFGLEPGQPPPNYLENLRQQIYANDQVRETTVSQAIALNKPYEFEFQIARPNGETRYVFAKERPILNSEGQVVRLFGTLLDITERKQAEEARSKSEEQFRLTFELAPIGMAIETLDGKFMRVNQSLCDTLGYTSLELLNQTWASVTYPDDLAVTLALNQKLCQEEISDFQIENRYLAKDGRLVYGILQVAPVRDFRGNLLHLISQFMDITDRKQAEEQLLYSALHDALTNLPNRTLLMERLDLALKRAKRAANPVGLRRETTAAHEDYLVAVLFIDLDRFKVINDSFGHQLGDQLLVAIARKLETIVRSTDTVARLGGDEFIILLDPIQDINDAIRFADRISGELRLPFDLEGRKLFATASIGIALSSTDYDQGSDLLQNADIAMFRAKKKGKARYEVFDQVMYTQALEQLQLENDLRQAVVERQFQVYYQPIVSLNTGKLTGFEALVRWQHPVRGLVSPAEFIPMAEETGLIVPIGEWVLREAAQEMIDWQTKFSTLAPLKISVNLSVKQLKEPDFLEKIDSILAQTGLAGQSLQLELTESMLMDNVKQLIGILNQLRARAIQLSIDDFGTGYSSLSYLHRFPVNNLKIDRSFVSRIGDQGENRELVETIVTLAHQLGMEAIAEGVETQEQLNQLKALNCEQAQGYLFSKPLERESAEALISRYVQTNITNGVVSY